MKTDDLLNQILPILHSVKNDADKLQRILDFLQTEFCKMTEDAIVIPEKYRGIVTEIAQFIDCGLNVYLNLDTNEIEAIHPEMDIDFEELDDEECKMDEDITDENWEENLNHFKWEHCVNFEPPLSHESFNIMEQFIDEIDNKQLQKRLVGALNNRRPFANFKVIVDDSNYRMKWFTFKQQQLEAIVWDELQLHVDVNEK